MKFWTGWSGARSAPPTPSANWRDDESRNPTAPRGHAARQARGLAHRPQIVAAAVPAVAAAVAAGHSGTPLPVRGGGDLPDQAVARIGRRRRVAGGAARHARGSE